MPAMSQFGTTGSMSAVMLIVSLGGITITYALYKDYDVEYEVQPDGKIKVKLTKK